MKKGRHYLEEEIRCLAQSVIGKTFNDLRTDEVIFIDDSKIQKGSLGGIIEEDLYGIEPNSESLPDFIDAGIELKVTPYKKNKNNTLSAKERLVLNMIDYFDEYKNDFKSSHFWLKNNKLEIIWYLYDENKNKYDFIITHELLFDLSLSEDLLQIEKDFYFITNKIKNGKAHELSEADTMYLGAAPKGANSKDLRKQPFNSLPAMRRAFAFKTSYMTQLVRKYIGNYYNVEKILKNSTTTLEEFVEDIINKYKNKSQEELMQEFNLTSHPKNLNSILINRMFNVTKLSDTEEFQKAKIIPKTIRIEENGHIKESISFPYFKYIDLANQTWETSKLKEELETTKYMFFVFKKEHSQYIFKGIKLWNMPELDIENHVMNMWNNTYNTVISGNIVKSINNNIRKTNFVGMSENPVCHVRPHGKNANDTCKLPVPDKLTGATEYTKHCFWINNNYIKNIFNEYL